MLSQVSETWSRVADTLRSPLLEPLSTWLEGHLRLPTGLAAEGRSHGRTGTVDRTSLAGAQRPEISPNFAEADANYYAAKCTALARAKRKPRPESPGGLLTLPKVATHLGVSPKTVVGYVNDHKLRSINLGRGKKRPTYRFAQSDLDTFIKQQEAKPCPPLTSSVRAIRRYDTSFGSEVIAIADRLRSGTSAKRKP